MGKRPHQSAARQAGQRIQETGQEAPGNVSEIYFKQKVIEEMALVAENIHDKFN